MATITTASPHKSAKPVVRTAGGTQAFWMLRILFAALPIAMGVDKFYGFLANWNDYLARWIARQSPFTNQHTLWLVGVAEIGAGLLVLLAPRIGAYVVALGLAGIIVDLVSMRQYYDIAARDFGLMVAALALGSLAWANAKTKKKVKVAIRREVASAESAD